MMSIPIPKDWKAPDLLRDAEVTPTALTPQDMAERVLSDLGERCGACGAHYLTVYWLPDSVWNAIRGGVNLLCPACADRQARKLGLTLYWQAGVNEYPCSVLADSGRLASDE